MMVTEPRPASIKTAIIGAGMAGLTCARMLQQRGHRPTVFDKSRGLGGRMATRRSVLETNFDHGAQYVTARTSEFRAALQAAAAQGHAESWQPKAGSKSDIQAQDWFIGIPGMNGLVKPLAEGIDLRLSNEIADIRRDGRHWQLRSASATAPQSFDAVVCTTPAPQSQRLLPAEADVAAALEDVAMAPCWALMLVFATPFETGFDAWRAENGDLAWAARNSSKPQRGARDSWIVHAGSEWSLRNLEAEPREIIDPMLDLLSSTFALPLPRIEHAAAHRWRYARTLRPLGQPFLRCGDGSLFLGGDWCLGARVEAAFESGAAIAKTLIEDF